MARPVAVHVPPADPSHPARPTPSHPPAHVPAPTPASVAAHIPETPPPPAPATPPAVEPSDGLVHLAIDRLVPNPHQPRQDFDAAALQRLADSIRADGLMQPIIVRRSAPGTPGTPGSPASLRSTPVNGQYQIIAGERRWRAAQIAGLTEVPTIVRDMDDQQAAEWALIENLQREDLNPIERAAAFRRLIDQYQLSHDQIAQRVGVDRSTVTNTLRLLALHPDIQQLVRDNRLTLGHAKALAAIAEPEQQTHLAQRAVRSEWSVRHLEAAVKQLTQPVAAEPANTHRSRQVHLDDLEQQLTQQLGTRVRLRPARKKGAGTLMIEFYSLDQFDALLSRMGVVTEV